MDLVEGKEKFLHIWGTMSSQWGISRAMAEIHGLLLLTNEPICTEDIMEKLKMSRGNVHINLRALMDWNLIQKVLKEFIFTIVQDLTLSGVQRVIDQKEYKETSLKL